jgi:hypothetical protein
VAERFPKSAAASQALYSAGIALRDQGKPDEALAALREVTVRFPFAKYSEDALLAAAELHATRKDDAKAAETVEALLQRFPNSGLAPEAMLLLASLKSRQKAMVEAGSILAEVRAKFPNTPESVKALDAMGDNARAEGKADDARKLWTQVMEEARTLSEGKYVWYVNVQAQLQKLADGARAKLGEGAK